MDNKKSNFKEINYEQVKETPFTLVEANGKYTMLIGNTQVCEWHETKEEALKISDIKNLSWTSLLSIVTTLVERWEEIKELKELKS